MLDEDALRWINACKLILIAASNELKRQVIECRGALALYAMSCEIRQALGCMQSLNARLWPSTKRWQTYTDLHETWNKVLFQAGNSELSLFGDNWNLQYKKDARAPKKKRKVIEPLNLDWGKVSCRLVKGQQKAWSIWWRSSTTKTNAICTIL